jgi:hypothetical protein
VCGFGTQVRDGAGAEHAKQQRDNQQGGERQPLVLGQSRLNWTRLCVGIRRSSRPCGAWF